MKPVLVHVHVFYPSVWPELRACVQNIAPHPFELIVTLVEHQEELEAGILADFPVARIELVENRGYDIAPFLHVLSLVSLDDYSYVVKLHTKRAESVLPFRDFKGREWRDCLLAFLSSPERFESHLAAFEANPAIGMQADYRLLVTKDIHGRVFRSMFNRWLKQHHLPRIPFTFVAGTMFVARAPLMKKLLEFGVKSEDFSTEHSHGASLAHVMERLFGYIICQQGYLVADRGLFHEAACYERRMVRRHYLEELLRFFYQRKVTSKGKLIVKIMKIPVFRRSLPKSGKA